MAAHEEALGVCLSGIHCGRLIQNAHGAMSFAYESGYEGIPLSLSMPIGLAKYPDRVARPFFAGLLPDEERTRAALGAAFGVSGDNPFKLLERMGSDCPGAVQVLPEGVGMRTEECPGDLVALTEFDISQKLADIHADAAAAWTGMHATEGHWSLGGCQAKLALRYQDGTWFECHNAAATTHILKPGVAGMDSQALIEHLSMGVATQLGLPCAKTAYVQFADEPAVVVERYDRVWRGDKVARLHQEDLCQAMGISPLRKYAEQGGPSTPQIVRLLRGTGANARENVYRFVLYLFFNYLIGATDAHAKNHSIVFASPDDIRLAPLYDVASAAPYMSLAPTQRKPPRAALSIGGENRFGMVGAKEIQKMTLTCNFDELGLGVDLLRDRLAMMADKVPQALHYTLAEARAKGIRVPTQLEESFVLEVEANCRRTVDRL